MHIVTGLISDVHFHITGPKITFKTYNYRHCDTSMSPKTADYFSSGGVIATLLGNCKVLCYANMNVTLFRVSANQRSIYGLYIKSAPFFSDLKNLLETKNNSRFYILKLFFLLHGNRFSSPVTSLVSISLQSWCILFKIRKNQRFWPNKCFLLLS